MDSIAFEFLPYFRAYKDGRVERFFGTDVVPPSTDPLSGVTSKDAVVVPNTAVSARLFAPTSALSCSNAESRKLPLLVYFHGGAFCFGSPFCATYHHYLSSLVALANVIAVSIDYRLAPESLIPAAYDDSWAALKWVASHSDGSGPDPWLNRYADLRRVFVAGDSAGANIAHNTVKKAGVEREFPPAGMKISGICLVHPDFADREGRPLPPWRFVCPDSSGADDPRMNPGADPELSKLGCERVLVFVAEKDSMKDRGVYYYETVGRSGWVGAADIVETAGEGHVFHLFDPKSENAVALLNRFAAFLNDVDPVETSPTKLAD